MSTRYINDMIIRYYTLGRTIREISEDTENFSLAERDTAVESLVKERLSIRNLLDQALADSVHALHSS